MVTLSQLMKHADDEAFRPAATLAESATQFEKIGRSLLSNVGELAGKVLLAEALVLRDHAVWREQVGKAVGSQVRDVLSGSQFSDALLPPSLVGFAPWPAPSAPMRRPAPITSEVRTVTCGSPSSKVMRWDANGIRAWCKGHRGTPV